MIFTKSEGQFFVMSLNNRSHSMTTTMVASKSWMMLRRASKDSFLEVSPQPQVLMMRPPMSARSSLFILASMQSAIRWSRRRGSEFNQRRDMNRRVET